MKIESYDVTQKYRQYKSAHCVKYKCYKDIPEYMLNKVQDGGWTGLLYYSTEYNIEAAKKAFINYYNTRIIPTQLRYIEDEQKKLFTVKQELNELETNSFQIIEENMER